MTRKDNLNIIIVINIVAGIVSLLGKIIDCLLKLPPSFNVGKHETRRLAGRRVFSYKALLASAKPPNGAVNWHKIYPNVRWNTCRCGLTPTKTQLMVMLMLLVMLIGWSRVYRRSSTFQNEINFISNSTVVSISFIETGGRCLFSLVYTYTWYCFQMNVSSALGEIFWCIFELMVFEI